MALLSTNEEVQRQNERYVEDFVSALLLLISQELHTDVFLEPPPFFFALL